MRLETSPGTRKSLVMKAEFAQVRKLLATSRNFWREYLAKWNITNVTPYIAGARPNPALIAREDAERKARLDEETERLRKAYGVADRQEALKRFAVEADAELARIEKATHVPPTPFVKSPPLTLDDDLRYEEVKLANGVPLVYSRFDNMTGAFTGIALRLDGVPRDELRYVSLLPQLLVSAGVVENGRPVSYEEMRERQRKEILELRPSFSANTRTGRIELVLRGSGVGVEESRRALDWMELVLFHPDWRPANLARIRDVVDQELAALRSTMQQPEEYWVNDPANAYRMQRHPAYARRQLVPHAHAQRAAPALDAEGCRGPRPRGARRVPLEARGDRARDDARRAEGASRARQGVRPRRPHARAARARR